MEFTDSNEMGLWEATDLKLEKLFAWEAGDQAWADEQEHEQRPRLFHDRLLAGGQRTPARSTESTQSPHHVLVAAAAYGFHIKYQRTFPHTVPSSMIMIQL